MSKNVVKAQEQVIDRDVKNNSDESLGIVKEIMLDKTMGRVAYLVLESGAFLWLGGKLFSIPWSAIKYNNSDDCFILDVSKDKLEKAPGFDKNNWPDMTDKQFGSTVAKYYDTTPYWE